MSSRRTRGVSFTVSNSDLHNNVILVPPFDKMITDVSDLGGELFIKFIYLKKLRSLRENRTVKKKRKTNRHSLHDLGVWGVGLDRLNGVNLYLLFLREMLFRQSTFWPSKISLLTFGPPVLPDPRLKYSLSSETRETVHWKTPKRKEKRIFPLATWLPSLTRSTWSDAEGT